MQLQEGVYYQQGQRPRGHFLLTFIAADETARAAEVGAALTSLWTRLRALKLGNLPALPGHPVPTGNLDCLLGYGPKAFKLPGSPLPIPPELAPANRFLSPRSTGGGQLLIGAGIEYAPDIVKNMATEEMVLQFTGDTALAVRRAYVETWKELASQNGPLKLGMFFDGFQRDDGRSWLDFHDGLSNLASGQDRHDAIRIKSGTFVEGTTLAFLRLEVDLSLWASLTPTSQEDVVGRVKGSGCPIVAYDASGNPAGDAACPVTGSDEVLEPGNEAFREPPLGVPSAIRRSHVQRANFAHNQATGDPGSFRIFRQGYEFLESRNTAPAYRAGLNFVSFQDTPRRILGLLTRSGWLGNTNFGGGTGSSQDMGPKLLSCRAGGIYLVPPVDDPDLLPGRAILGL